MAKKKKQAHQAAAEEALAPQHGSQPNWGEEKEARGSNEAGEGEHPGKRKASSNNESNSNKSKDQQDEQATHSSSEMRQSDQNQSKKQPAPGASSESFLFFRTKPLPIESCLLLILPSFDHDSTQNTQSDTTLTIKQP